MLIVTKEHKFVQISIENLYIHLLTHISLYAIMNWWNIYCHTLISYNINTWRVKSFQNRKDILGSNDKLTFDQENKFFMQSCKMYLLRKSNEDYGILKWKVIVSWEQSFSTLPKHIKSIWNIHLKWLPMKKGTTLAYTCTI